MATGRRIIFSSYVVPTQSVEGEETSIRHTEFISSPGKALGGKGTATIHATQWGDAWSSATHPLIQNWEEFTTVNWEDVLIHPAESGKITVATSPVQLTSENTDCAFLYIRNLGDSDDDTYDDAVVVALDETGLAGGGSTDGNYYITIPPGGSVCLRGDGTNLECREVYVKCASGTTQIEYLIAIEA